MSKMNFIILDDADNYGMLINEIHLIGIGIRYNGIAFDTKESAKHTEIFVDNEMEMARQRLKDPKYIEQFQKDVEEHKKKYDQYNKISLRTLFRPFDF